MTLNSLQAYGHDFQIKVLSSLLTHKEFLINIHDIISDEYFDNQAVKWCVGEILNYFDKKGSIRLSFKMIKPVNQPKKK